MNRTIPSGGHEPIAFHGHGFRRAFLALFLMMLPACTDSLPDGLPDDVTGPNVCSLCHGSADNAAPPLSVSGLSSTSEIEVGAHQTHMTGGAIRAALPCESCHVVPLTIDAPGHRDASPAEITWSSLAKTGGLTPVWDRDGATCSSVYCHGATLSGGTLTTPVWTQVGTGQADCGTCHGNPPPLPHEQNSACYLCHWETVTPSGDIDADSHKHIDGIVQGSDSPHPDGWNEPAEHGYGFYDDPNSCKACHGDNLDGGLSVVSCDNCHTGGAAWRTDCLYCHGGQDNNSGAPPLGLRGETLRSSVAVGAHTVHLTESPSHTAWECSVCHIVPTSWNDPGHIDGTAEVHFSTTAGSSAAYSSTTTTCSSLYCHGTGRSVSGSVSWTSTTALTCRSCHGYYDNPRMSSGEHGEHLSEGVRCYQCHQTVVNSSNEIIGKSAHINGSPTVSLVSGTYNPSTRTCGISECHDETMHW